MDEARRQDGQISRRALLHSAGVLALCGAGASLIGACAGSDEDDPKASAANGIAVTLYRQKGCSCCASYADYLADNGYAVDMKTMDDLEPIREQYRVPSDAVGCHTSLIDDYVVEGHVPVEAIDRVLAERPDIEGISVVGMPVNSPGMGDPNGEPLEVLSFGDGHLADYMSVTTF